MTVEGITIDKVKILPPDKQKVALYYGSFCHFLALVENTIDDSW